MYGTAILDLPVRDIILHILKPCHFSLWKFHNRESVLQPWDKWNKIMSVYLVDYINNRQQNDSICGSPQSPQNLVLMVCAFLEQLFKSEGTGNNLLSFHFLHFVFLSCFLGPLAALLTFVFQQWQWKSSQTKEKLRRHGSPRLWDSLPSLPDSWDMILERSFQLWVGPGSLHF